MKALNRSYGVALGLVVLICGSVHCKTPGGPFVTVTINGIPTEATQLVMNAKLDVTEHAAETSPKSAALPLTIDLPAGARGPLLLSAKAMVSGTSCTLATGTATVQLDDDIAYETTLDLVPSSLEGCMGVSTIPTASITLTKVETGGSGSISSSPAGIDCVAGAGCTTEVARYRVGAKVMLVAKPALGSRVTWSEKTCPLNVCTVTVSQTANQDTAVTATFGPCPSNSWCDEGVSTVTSDLYGVWGSSSTAVYAVGDAGTIALRSGNQWVPLTSGVTVPLRAIGGDGVTNTVYAGGDNATLLKLAPPFKWNVVTEARLANQQITGIYGDDYNFPQPKINFYFSTNKGGFYLLNGNTWNTITDSALTTAKVLHGVSAGHDVFANREATVVGDGGLVVRYGSGGTADNTAGSMTTAPLRGVWTGGGLSVAVGDNGTIITRGTGDYGNGGSKNWTKVTSNVTSRLNAVWGVDDGNIWIVGDGGVILKYDGKMTVTKSDNVPLVDLNSVWAVNKDSASLYAVGRGGAILHYQP